MLDQRAQAVAVRRNDDPFSGAQFGDDGAVPIGEDAGDGVFETLGRGHGHPGIAAVIAQIIGAASLQRWRRDVKAAAPDFDLLLARLRHGLGFVQAGQAAVVTLVQSPVLDHRQPQPPHRLQRQVQCLDRAGLVAGEAQVEVIALGTEQRASRLRLRRANLGDINVPPAGEAVFKIPGRLAVAEQDEAGHGERLTQVADHLKQSRQTIAAQRLRPFR